MIYYEALDLVTSCIKNRFDQQDYLVHSACERLLLKAVNGGDFHEDINAVVEFYGSDFSRESLSILATLDLGHKFRESIQYTKIH